MHDDKIRCFLDKLGTGWVTFSKKPSPSDRRSGLGETDTFM